MHPPALDIADLRVDYDSKRALDSVSLQLASGEILGIVGPNGSGKTSLMRSITGKLSPTAGSIHVEGRKLWPGKAHRHAIAFAPQSLGLYGHLTARENLEVFGRFAGLPARHSRQRATQALADVQLADDANTLARHLSGGMQRRLHIAATFLTNPKLLVLDESAAGVDLAARATIHELIQKRATEGAAVVLVTHELNEAEKLCHKIGILHSGRLLQLASPHQLVAKVFGMAQLFCVATDDTPAESVQDHFRRMGLKPAGNFREWTMGAELSLADFVKQLYRGPWQDCTAIRDLYMRRPNLNDVMRHITGMDLTARAAPQPTDKPQEFSSATERALD